MKGNEATSRPLRFHCLYSVSAAVLVCITCSLYGQPSKASSLRAVLRIPSAIAQGNATQAQKAEAENLFQAGIEQFRHSQYREALETYQQVLKLRQAIADKAGEGETLYRIGVTYRDLARYPQASEAFERALTIARSLDDNALIGRTLNEIGFIYYRLSQYPKAKEFYQQALAIAREISDQTIEAYILDNLGAVYYRQGEYDRALKFHQQALTLSREVGDRAAEGLILSNIGIVYDSLGDYSKALMFARQGLAITRNIGDRFIESRILNNIGATSGNLGQYARALEFYEQSLAIVKEIGARAGEGRTLNSIAGIYYSLGQYAEALKVYQQSLAIYREVRDQAGEALTLNNIGLTYNLLGQYAEALEVYQQALAIRREIGDKAGEASTLNNIALTYDGQKREDQAQVVFGQALAIRREIGDKAGEGISLNNIGGVHQNLGEYSQALESYQQALGTFQEIGNRPGERSALSNIGSLLEQQHQTELAIIFYKQSVNVTEAIRQDLQPLSSKQQQSYTTTVADSYRRLADLLLKQDRVLEAQQVLDLLKIQELDDYLRNVRGKNNRGLVAIELRPQEQQILENYTLRQDEAIKLGKELAQLRQIPLAERTPTQTQRIAELERIQQQIRQKFNDFIRTPEIVALVQQLNRTTGSQNLDLPNLNRLQRQLQQVKQNAVVLYPLILEDRLELVLVTPYSPPIRRTVPIKRENLNQAIVEFRRAITNRVGSADRVNKPALQLYNILIKPIENDLIQTNAQTIVYAPDGQLRYIPLGALFDGKQWLVQRFSINNITAASLIDFKEQRRSTLPRVLAAAFSEGSLEFQVGKQRFAFTGLRFAGREVENIAALIPDTKKLLNRAFSREATIPQLNDYNIVHFATHAAFVPGQPDESFILFGNGDRATLRDIETWNLTQAELVVLSACETGVSGILGNGEEILGLGYQMQQAGALATIASLWVVDDEGTEVLMNAFYKALRQGNTKALALRQAQTTLLNSEYNAPYYWAPFILIGNGF
jgi:CHAT domain-containing protein